MTDITTPAPERWLPVVGYRGLYEVSDSGTIRRPAGLDSIGRPRRDRTLKPTNDGRGYLVVSLCKDAIATSARVHVIVAAAFIGIRPVGRVVNHIDADRKNNRLANLEYVTPRENDHHAARLGRKAKGERHGMAIIGPEIARKIRRLYHDAGLTSVEIAKLYGLHPSHILKIANGQHWADA